MSADTIFALSSGRPPAAIAVIRISGPGAHAAGEALAGPLPEARRASVREVRVCEGAVLDRALVLRFYGPASATGEDSVELHCHGGRAVADAVLGALAGLGGLRAAQPGEFTRRAFENGRIDLTEAEGLADLLEAETESQRRAALAMAEGGLRREIDRWQERLLSLSARAEAAIDYIDDDGVTADLSLASESANLAAEIGEWLQRPRIEPLRDGIRVVIAGPPNAGKSSLLNMLVGSEKAIVTPVPGTTRDRIEVPVAISGIPMVLTDTAGIRSSHDPVERLGVDRARECSAAADVLLWLGDPADVPEHSRLILVHSRCDLPGRESVPEGSVGVSAATGEGAADLLLRMGEVAKTLLPAEDAIALNRRQAAHLEAARLALASASVATGVEIVADQLRIARTEFNRLTGRAEIEDVLDALFGRFCLGK